MHTRPDLKLVLIGFFLIAALAIGIKHESWLPEVYRVFIWNDAISASVPQTGIVHIAPADYGAWRSVIEEKPLLQWTDNGATTTVYAIRNIDRGPLRGTVLALQKGSWNHVFFIAQPDGKRVASFNEYPDSSGLPKIPTDELPQELRYALFDGVIKTTDDGKISFGSGVYVYIPKTLAEAGTALPNISIAGMSVFAQPEVSSREGRLLDSFQKNNYRLQLPFGGFLYLMPILYGIEKDDGTVAVTWTRGDSKVAQYQDPHYAESVEGCIPATMTLADVERTLLETGITGAGSVIYEINPDGHEDIYRCLYEKTKKTECVCERGDCGVIIRPYQESFDTFLIGHPLFFVRHGLGDLLPYVRLDVQSPDGKGCGDSG